MFMLNTSILKPCDESKLVLRVKRVLEKQEIGKNYTINYKFAGINSPMQLNIISFSRIHKTDLNHPLKMSQIWHTGEKKYF